MSILLNWFAAVNVISRLGGRGGAREREAGEKLEGQKQSVYFR